MSEPMSINDRTERNAGYTFILIFALMAMGIVLIGYLYYLNYERNYRTALESDLSSIVKLKVGGLVEWRKERLGDGSVLFRNTSFSALVRRFLENPGDVDTQRQLQDWMGKYTTAYEYTRVYLVDTQGKMRMSVPEAPGPYVSSVARHVTEILRSGHVGIEDFHRNTPDAPIHLAVVIPIFDSADDSRPLGVLSLHIDPHTHLYPFVSGWPWASETSETLLVRRDGDDALFLSELLFHKNAPLNLRIPLTKTDVPAVRAALGQTGVFEGVDYRGAPVIAAVRPVPDSPWAMVARMNTSEVYAAVRERMWEMSVFIGVLLFGSGAAMGFVWRQKSARHRERDKVAEAILESETRFRQLAEATFEGVAISESGRILDVNKQFLEMFGYEKAEEVVGKTALEFAAPEYHELATANIAAGYEKPYEIMGARKGGSFFPIEIRGKMMEIAGRRIRVTALRDITERKKAEDALRLAKEQAESSTKLKDQFVSLVAHDLRAPFTSMMGLLRLFAERKPCLEDAESQKVLDMVFKSGDRMLGMIDQLLKISRLQTGQITPQPRFFNGHTSVAFTINSISHNAAQKGIVIVNDVPADMRLYADQVLFDEVLLNLMTNAIKFCSRGDRVTVFTPPGLKSAIAVRDTGKGIGGKNISDIFRHDVKTTTPGTDGELGTGLGLPYSYDIMKAHGGELTVESAPGKGSVFCAMLPYARPVALVVDDEPMARLIARSHLEKIGVDVVEAESGAKALSCIKDKRPHIIIADIMMPGMDGFELLGLLKQDVSTRGIPLIVMTSVDGEIRDKALRRGADDFVGKPVTAEDFVPRVRKFVG